MSYYGYDKFVYPVPLGHTIPKGTPTRRVEPYPNPVETFFTTPFDLTVYSTDEVTYYLTMKPELPKEINSVIYNVRTDQGSYALAVYQGSYIWSAFSDSGQLTPLYTPEIKSFDKEDES